MFNRRSLFKRLGAIIAVVALAPEIAFRYTLRVKPELVNPPAAGATYFNSSNSDMYVSDGRDWLLVADTTT